MVVDLGLVVEYQLLAWNGVAQVRFQRGPFQHGHLHGGIEEAQGIASHRLGFVHGQVRLLEQIVDAGQIAHEERRADTRGAAVSNLVEPVGLAQFLQYLVADDIDLGRRLFRIHMQVRQHDDELIAAQAGHGVACTHAADQAPRDLIEQQVAHVVSKRVVERLEIVQIDEQDGAMVAAAQAGLLRLLQAVQQQDAVGQLGELIEEGQLLYLLLCLLALGPPQAVPFLYDQQPERAEDGDQTEQDALRIQAVAPRREQDLGVAAHGDAQRRAEEGRARWHMALGDHALLVGAW